MLGKRVLIVLLLALVLSVAFARPPPRNGESKMSIGKIPPRQLGGIKATDAPEARHNDDEVNPPYDPTDSETEDEDEGNIQLRTPVSRSRTVAAGTETGATRFVAAFFRSAAMIVTSEIGDKTFFIAAIMAMKHPRWEVFISAITALLLMTVLSAAMGFTLPNLLPPEVTHWASVALFLFFGVKLLKNAWEMGPQDKPNEEAQEVEEELEKLELEDTSPEDLESGREKAVTMVHRVRRKLGKYLSPVFIQCFTMTFAAEWGDRSQISTIALAAAYDPIGVTLGGIIGHAICTGGAVLSGKWAATRISERAVAWVGGALFLVFALHSIYTGPEVTSSHVV